MRGCRAAVALAVRRTLEEHTTFLLAYARFQRDDLARVSIPSVLADVPSPLRGIIGKYVRKSMIKALHGQVPAPAWPF